MLQCTDGQLNTNMKHSWVLFFGLMMTSCSLSSSCTNCFCEPGYVYLLMHTPELALSAADQAVQCVVLPPHLSPT